MCSGHTQKELPPEIIQVIFSKLPLPNLPICRLVCKAWNDLVLDHASSTSKLVPNTFFMCKKTDDMHIGQSQPIQCIGLETKHPGMMTSSFASFTFDRSWSKVGIANSCNGLLCIFEGQKWGTTPRAAILNPMTNEYINLPGGYEVVEKDILYYYGLGFSPKTKQYKIARVFNTRPYSIVVEIYTFGRNDTWRPIDSNIIVMHSNGVYFDGGIYWVGRTKEDCCIAIFRLDVEKEKLETITRLDPFVNLSIGVFNDCLYATFCMFPSNMMEVWMMRSNGWIREFVFECISRDLSSWWNPYKLQLIKAFEDGEIMGIVDELYLLLNNPKTGTTKTFNKTDGRVLWVHQIDSYTFDSLQKILTPAG